MWTAYKKQTRNYVLAIVKRLGIKQRLQAVFKKNLYEDNNKIYRLQISIKQWL